ncbi:sigma-70 family RNA polymerase sigma factor [Candidatus Uhrbacteria bacterium]|nr:MAG: sigma-70 family RNA polymerase sigma factor [Candidatus Uhrbacteria bacterium]
MDLTKQIRGSVIVTDTESRVLFASEGVRDRTGFDVPEIIGKRPSELWGGRMPRPFYQAMWSELAKGQPYAETVVNRRKNGDAFEVALSIAPLRDEWGGVTGYVALQPEHESESFRDEFFRAAAPDASPARFRDLLEERFGWRTGVWVMHRAGLLELIDRTLVEPMRLRFHARTEDAALIANAQREREAFGVIVAKYQGVLRRFFRYRLSDPERAEDLVQETFERAFRALPGFESRNASYQTYLLRIAQNLVVSEYRRHDSPIITEAPVERAWVGRLEARDELDRAMEMLDERDRDVIRLYYREGYSVREIASLWETSENAIKLRLSRARRRLARSMGRTKGVA